MAGVQGPEGVADGERERNFARLLETQACLQPPPCPLPPPRM